MTSSTPKADQSVDPVDAVEPAAPAGPVDVVAVPSLRADGTPDQTPGFITLVADEPAEQA